jgi:hypothetical protein
LRRTFASTAEGRRELASWLRRKKVGKAVMEASGGFYVVLTTFAAAQLWKVALLAASATFAYALMVAIGVIILIAPYAIVATPMALAHRWLLLKIFAPADPAPEPVK